MYHQSGIAAASPMNTGLKMDVTTAMSGLCHDKIHKHIKCIKNASLFRLVLLPFVRNNKYYTYFIPDSASARIMHVEGLIKKWLWNWTLTIRNLYVK
jgi:hypothetical protein